MNKFYDTLKKHIADHQSNLDNGDSVLILLYKAHSECNRLDYDRVKADFKELYHQMNGMTLPEIERILDPICSLYMDHERAGFIEGIRSGIRLQ